MDELKRRYLSTDGFRELVRSVKDPTQIDTNQLAVVSSMPTEIKALGGADSRLIEFIITSDRVDREQDILAVDGWDFEDYEKNPVVLWCHDHYGGEVGYMPVVANAKSLTRSGNKIKSIAEFTPQELNPFGYMTYRMYAGGFMHAVSVGFQPKEYTFAEDRKYGINFVKQSLLEYSCVPVPANPDALVVARSKGIDTTPMFKWAEQVLDDSRSDKDKLTDDARKRLEILRTCSSPNGRSLILNIGELKTVPAPAGKEEVPPVTEPKKQVAGVETLTRYRCLRGHDTHETEDDAQACNGVKASLEGARDTLNKLLPTAEQKAGRTLSAANETRVRNAVAALNEVLSQLDQQEEETETTDEGKGVQESGVLITQEPSEDEGRIAADPDLIRALVTQGVTEAVNRVTGRVD